MTGGGRWRYAPITRGSGPRWPNGAGLAVYVAVGVESYRFGDGRTEDIIPGVPAPDLVNASWRDYGNRVGAFRLLDRLAGLGIPPTVLLNALVADEAPALVARLRESGCETVAHGLSNSDILSGMAEAAERRYLAETRDRIARERLGPDGGAPLGWSSPWLAHTERTVDLLVEAGYRYLLDLRLDDRPVWLEARGGPLLALPYALELNDSSTAIGRFASARDFADMIVDEFDEMLAAWDGAALVMPIVVHAFISGQPFRLRQLTRALAHVAAHRDRVWLTTPGAIHAAVLAEPGLAVR